MSLILDLRENIYTQVFKTHYISAGEAGRHVVGFLDLFIDVFLEVQDKKQGQARNPKAITRPSK